jgi:integrase
LRETDMQAIFDAPAASGSLRLDERRVARDRLILGLLMIEGLREAEVAALRLDGIRRVFDRAGQSYLAIEVAGKGSKLRDLVLAERTALLLDTYLTVHQRRLGESGPLFPSAGPRRPRRPRPDEWIELLPPPEDHLSPTRIRQLVYDYARRVLPPDMRIGPHHLRHTAVTDWLDEGAGLREAQLHAGHSSPVTTQSVYDHASLRPERSASRKGRLGQADAEQDNPR